MATSGCGSGILAYNVQAAADTEHHPIVTQEVINVGNDRGLLALMPKQAKEVLEVDKLGAVARWLLRRGGGDISLRRGWRCSHLAQAHNVERPRRKGRFGKQDLAYLPDDDAGDEHRRQTEPDCSHPRRLKGGKCVQKRNTASRRPLWPDIGRPDTRTSAPCNDRRPPPRADLSVCTQPSPNGDTAVVGLAAVARFKPEI